MILNITAGESMNMDFEKKNIRAVPFNESMICGTHHNNPFTEEFIVERTRCLSTTELDYHQKMDRFFDAIKHIHDFDEIHLWFGTEPFCNENRAFVIQFIEKSNYQGKVFFHAMDEKEQNEVSVTEIIIKHNSCS